ncbi:HEAT repeat domain-containing protein [Candidatus Micrarchaeota archaeon]|nr:HEAT repeat domain-containing protein [Candidatus Micrarchaeota archaeon]
MNEKPKKDIIPIWFDRINSGDETTRLIALRNPLKAVTQKDTPYLIKTLEHKDPSVRIFAINALGKASPKIAIPHLIKSLRDGFFTSMEAAHSLDKIGLPSIMPLIEDLKNAPEHVKYDNFKIIDSILDKARKGKKFKSNHPIFVALNHINPREYPNSFLKFYGEFIKNRKKSKDYWKLTAKQLTALEGRLK